MLEGWKPWGEGMWRLADFGQLRQVPSSRSWSLPRTRRAGAPQVQPGGLCVAWTFGAARPNSAPQTPQRCIANFGPFCRCFSECSRAFDRRANSVLRPKRLSRGFRAARQRQQPSPRVDEAWRGFLGVYGAEAYTKQSNNAVSTEGSQ